MTFAEIEAAAAALPLEKQKKLLSSLEAYVQKATAEPPAKQSVLDIPAVSVGEILKPLTREDDLLDEMLEGRM